MKNYVKYPIESLNKLIDSHLIFKMQMHNTVKIGQSCKESVFDSLMYLILNLKFKFHL